MLEHLEASNGEPRDARQFVSEATGPRLQWERCDGEQQFSPCTAVSGSSST
jgi:hypothetical protein